MSYQDANGNVYTCDGYYYLNSETGLFTRYYLVNETAQVSII